MFNKNRLHFVLAVALILALALPMLNAGRAAPVQGTPSVKVAYETHYSPVPNTADKPGDSARPIRINWDISGA